MIGYTSGAKKSSSGLARGEAESRYIDKSTLLPLESRSPVVWLREGSGLAEVLEDVSGRMASGRTASGRTASGRMESGRMESGCTVGGGNEIQGCEFPGGLKEDVWPDGRSDSTPSNTLVL